MRKWCVKNHQNSIMNEEKILGVESSNRKKSNAATIDIENSLLYNGGDETKIIKNSGNNITINNAKHQYEKIKKPNVQ